MGRATGFESSHPRLRRVLSPPTSTPHGRSAVATLRDGCPVRLLSTPPDLLVWRASRLCGRILPDPSPTTTIGTAIEAAALDRRVVAIAGFLQPQARYGELIVAVAPAWRRAGLGSVLLEAVVARAAERELRFLTLSHPPGDAGLEAVARRLSLVVVRRRVDGRLATVVLVPPVPSTPRPSRSLPHGPPGH